MSSSAKNISAILITKNEALNIVKCLESLRWADEVIMVDTHSADNTVELASAYSNVKISSSAWFGYSENKKIAVSAATNDWILWIDADEVVPADLKEEILRTLDQNDFYYAYDIPRKTFFLGEWVRYTGWYPGRVIRLFNKHHCRFNNRVLHEGVAPDDSARTGHLQSDLLHYSYQSLFQYFDKMNFYGKAGAEELRRKGKKFYYWQLIVNPLTTFVKFYFLKKGFLDGGKGFVISVGSAFSNFIKYTNFYYLQKNEKDNHQPH